MPVQITDLSKSYGEKKVLSHLTLTLPDHCCTALMGPSGCGKTTLLNILLGLTAADSGSITGMPQKKSAVFQEDRLCEDFSMIRNIRLVTGSACSEKLITEHLQAVGLANHLPESAPGTCSQAADLAEHTQAAGLDNHAQAVDLADHLHQPVRNLSGGMRRRISIVRAVLAASDIILLDEPFQGLDAETKRQVMDYFRQFTAGKTTLLVTHNEAEAAYLGSQCIHL